MSGWDDTYDFVVCGSGGGSMAAALAVRAAGKRALIIEKTGKIGGSTAMSGGVWWLPDNPYMKARGLPDSFERARLYMDTVIGPEVPGSTKARRDAYVRTSPVLCQFLAGQGMEFFSPRSWPDYYADLPGGESVSRSLVAKMFDLNELGPYRERLRTYPGFDFPLHTDDFPLLVNLKTTWNGKKAAMRMALQMLIDKLTGKRTRGQGPALQGRMLQMALNAELPIWTDTPVADVIVEDGRVVGVVATRNGKTVRIRALDGVLINAGGFARNAELRQRYQRAPAGAGWTSANPGDTGELLEAVLAHGGATYNLDAALWVITSRMPDGSAAPGQILPDGTDLPYIHVIDIGKPSLIMVDKQGKRFCNESGSYVEMGERMYQNGSIPAWIISDHNNRSRYPWGFANPGQTPKEWLRSGYMIKADTLEELARMCGIDPAGLRQTVERFNGFCYAGVDADFGRGNNAYHHWNGDPSVKPNPSLGPIVKPPFYAVTAFPGDVGTSGGLVCDEHARVLRVDGSPIAGLYAAGNCTASVMGRTYPGAGASIGASFIFGFLAARHACGIPPQ